MEYQLTLNWPDFLERHWQKRPVVLKRGFNNFIDPISPDELAGLAMESEVDSRLVSHQDGKWQVSHGPFESYDHLGETNWSLLVQAVNHWHEPTAALMRPFRELPDWRIDDLMISFSVPGGGVGPHLHERPVGPQRAVTHQHPAGLVGHFGFASPAVQPSHYGGLGRVALGAFGLAGDVLQQQAQHHRKAVQGRAESLDQIHTQQGLRTDRQPAGRG